MSEQHTTPTLTPNDLGPVQTYIQQQTPWLVILGTVGEPPMLAVKDTAHLNLCVGFRTQDDVRAYLSMFEVEREGKPSWLTSNNTTTFTAIPCAAISATTGGRLPATSTGVVVEMGMLL